MDTASVNSVAPKAAICVANMLQDYLNAMNETFTGTESYFYDRKQNSKLPTIQTSVYLPETIDSKTSSLQSREHAAPIRPSRQSATVGLESKCHKSFRWRPRSLGFS